MEIILEIAEMYKIGNLCEVNFSKSRKLKEYPKTGVRAYARTPVFGLHIVIL
jgi:hypothetical protein